MSFYYLTTYSDSDLWCQKHIFKLFHTCQGQDQGSTHRNGEGQHVNVNSRTRQTKMLPG